MNFTKYGNNAWRYRAVCGGCEEVLLDVMRSVEKIGKQEFLLEDVYAFEGDLSKIHTENRHIKDKIRQQLQVLRDKGYLEFTGREVYHG